MIVRTVLDAEHAVVRLADVPPNVPRFDVVAFALDVRSPFSATAQPIVKIGVVGLRISRESAFELVSETDFAAGGLTWMVLAPSRESSGMSDRGDLLGPGQLVTSASVATVIETIDHMEASHGALEFRHTSAGPLSTIRLTAREREIVAGVLAARSNDEIGGDLGIARKTVEAYLTRLYARYDLVSRTDLALIAQREDWLGHNLRFGPDTVVHRRELVEAIVPPSQVPLLRRIEGRKS